MKKLLRIYRRNIYGIIGTLLFHILLFSAFLLADIHIKGNVIEEEIVIEFPDILPEKEEINESEVQNTDNSNENVSSENQTNVASNRLATQNITKSTNQFFDDDYLKEVEAAKKLVSDVNNQLSKKIVDISEIKMPVETTEGINPDSIKNKNYTGESNIVYYLENRYHLSLPIPVYLTQSGGKVIVDITVNRQGFVTDAIPRMDKKYKDELIYIYAKTAALRTVFNADNNAPEAQKGTIQYTFVPQ